MEGPGDYYTAAEVEDALAWGAGERQRKADARWRARQEDTDKGGCFERAHE